MADINICYRADYTFAYRYKLADGIIRKWVGGIVLTYGDELFCKIKDEADAGIEQKICQK